MDSADSPPVSVPPCSACIQLGWNCSPTCVFAPCFPRNRPNKFAIVQRAYGALNVMSWLAQFPAEQRISASNQLVHNASLHLRSQARGSRNNNNNFICPVVFVNSDITEEEARRRLGTANESVSVTATQIEDDLPENPFYMISENFQPAETSGSCADDDSK